ncbi:DNA gyrase inhibitor YacG [Maribrevibacterium harenarium]|uniref:DNA gyrase inhibitor YacG n=1 Tax=Maribrevibacterium harenarium TaxID=2589817 RepID=A0A501X520_9GAMM|nr:DNA gyrase inhibitor YacG [Maribrevibacterium harenarium]TPE55606.1 DNA gyrase inhibitor YacG [Maribrevibacterium harenarium]
MSLTQKNKSIPCPTCRKDAQWSPENPYRPFCCERCKLIDLGEWASGTYSIAQIDSEEDEVFSGDLVANPNRSFL